MREMEDCWPSGVGLRGQASNRPVLRWLKTVVVSDREKAHEMRQVGTRKTCQKRPQVGNHMGVVVEASKSFRWHQNQRSCFKLWDRPGGCPLTGQVVPGVEAA